MTIRRATIFLLLVASVRQSAGKDKKHLPDDLLKAQTFAIVVSVDANEVAANPNVKETLQKQLETAMVNWGRYRPAAIGTADLLIVAHRGHVNPPDLVSRPDKPKWSNPNTGPGPYPDTPGLKNPGLDVPGREAAKLRAEEDSFEVYPARTQGLSDATRLWQYRAALALHGSKIAAIEKFRKAIDESEKQLKQKP
jgi:hypothetical protein